MTLGEALKPVSYVAQLQVMRKTDHGYDYVFSKDDFINRGIIEEFYPELLGEEITDGFHGEGMRPGLYAHI